DQYELNLCFSCLKSIEKEKIPALALANRTFVGPLPPELNDLTPIEESMIALCRSKCWIVQLSEQDHSDLTSPHVQRGFHGNIIIYPQEPQQVATVLPPSIEEITSPICVIFVGSKPPSREWLRDKAKPLAVRGDKVRQALVWFKTHNLLYHGIEINYNVLNTLLTNDLLPFHIEHVLPSEDEDPLTSQYDISSSSTSDVHPQPVPADAEIAFQKLVISDVEGHASLNELKAAALRHVQKKKGSYLKLPHGMSPENEFMNPQLFPKIYPTLFPFGIGGFEDPARKE
ncbi:hypothetical protein L208DRAFT_1304229, partial [Tricholoma matsutake]